MKTVTHTVQDIINKKVKAPIDLSVIPNYMGINLCSVDSLTWTRQPDGQLVNLNINFVPATPEELATQPKNPNL